MKEVEGDNKKFERRNYGNEDSGTRKNKTFVHIRCLERPLHHLLQNISSWLSFLSSLNLHFKILKFYSSARWFHWLRPLEAFALFTSYCNNCFCLFFVLYQQMIQVAF